MKHIIFILSILLCLSASAQTTNGKDANVTDMAESLAPIPKDANESYARVNRDMDEPDMDELFMENSSYDVLLSTITFKMGLHTIGNEHEMEIENIANHLLANPNTRLTITGYADIVSDNKASNILLSRNRAKAVYDVLADKYKIDKSRMTICCDGEVKQPNITFTIHN